MVADNGGLDHYGNPVSSTTPPNIGADNGSGTSVPVHTDLFDTRSASWTATGTVSVTADPSGDLGNSALLTGTSSLTRALGGTTGRRVAALVRSDSATTPVTVEALNSSGTVLATATPADTTAGEWHRAELTAPSTATALRLRATSGGTSYADDVIVRPIAWHQHRSRPGRRGAAPPTTAPVERVMDRRLRRGADRDADPTVGVILSGHPEMIYAGKQLRGRHA